MNPPALFPGSGQITRWALAIGALMFPIVSGGSAQISGGQVLAGNASIQQQGLLTTIHAGDQSVLRWDRFNIGAPETVQFIQPGADARVLNYIGGTSPSQIDGRLLANGQVYLMNPFGISFGRTAVVETAGLFAVAGQIAKEDFLAGVNRFTGLTGSVVNEGSISAGAVALVGERVANRGSIVAPGGFVALAAGDEVFLGERGGRIFVNTGKAAPPGHSKDTGVSNTGTVLAAQGRVVLAAGDLYSTAISNDGVVAGRDIALQGQGSGVVLNSGRIDASSREPGDSGGRIEVTGEKVGITAGARVDASGAAGGGTVLIGGDLQGRNESVRNAAVTVVENGAALRADATTAGDGGKVIVWADDTTRYHGELSARGAGSSGIGGFAEVSGKKMLDFTGTADLRAAGGQTGTLLLDPTNIFIAANQTVATAAGMVGTDSSASGGAPNFAANGVVQDSFLSTSILTTALGNATVSVTTTNPNGTGLGNITVASPIIWGSSSTLNLNAANNIVVNAAISAVDGGNVSLNAGGAITVGSAGIDGWNVSLAHNGTLSGPGSIFAQIGIALTGNGQVGASGAPIAINTPALTVNKLAGAAFLTHGGNSSLSLSATNLLSGGNITAGNVTLSGPVNAGTSTLALNTGAFARGNQSITAGNLTLNNSGLLTGTGIVTANSITLAGSGHVGAISAPFISRASTLVLAKTSGPGGAVLHLANWLNGGVSATGSVVGDQGEINLSSLDTIGQSPAPLTIGASGVTMTGSSSVVSLASSTLALSGGINSPFISILNTGAVTGNGTLSAPQNITLHSSGAVGAAGTGNATRINTPHLDITKTSGAVFVDNGGNPLLVHASGNGTGMLGGGAISAGNLTVDQSLAGGTSNITLTSAELSLDDVFAGNLTVNNSGPFTGFGTIDVNGLTLGGSGLVSGPPGNLVHTTASTLTLAKSGGGVFLSHAGSLSISGSTGNSDANIFVDGAISISSSLNLGTGTLRLQSAGGVSQTAAGTITANAVSVSNIEAGNIVLSNANVIGRFAGENDTGGTINVRSHVSNWTIGNVTGSGSWFNAIANVTTGGEGTGGNITLTNTLGNIVVSQPVQAFGFGNGTVNISGPTTVNAVVSAAANRTVTIAATFPPPPPPPPPTQPPPPPPIDLSSDTIINAPLVTGNLAISATRDVIINAPVTATSAGGLSIAADTDTNGTGGVLVTGNGSVTANALTAPLAITGSALVNAGSFGGAGLGVGNVFYLQTGGSINTVQPVSITARPSAGATAGIVINGSGTTPVISTSGGGITLAPGPAGTITLNGGSLTNPLLTATGTLDFGTRSVLLGGNVRLSAAATVFGGTVNGPYGLSLSGNGTFGGNVGATRPLTSLEVGGAATINADITTSGSQIYNAMVSGGGASSGSSITFAGAGQVGTAENPINLRTPALTINKTSGAVFATNVNNAPVLTAFAVTAAEDSGSLALNAIAMPAGGAITAGNIVLSGPLNAGTAPLALNANGTLNLGANAVTAGNLTINHTAGLSGTGTLLGSERLTLTGSGAVGAAGTGNATNIRTPALTVNKNAGAVFANTGSGDVTLTGQSMVGGGEITAGNLTVAAPLNAGSSSIVLNTSGTLNLGGSVAAGSVSINNTGALTGPGVVMAGNVTLSGSGAVGTGASPLQLQGGQLSFAKTSGSSFVGSNSALNVSGAVTNGDAAISAAGPLLVSGNLSVGSGTLRLSGTGGISQSTGSVVTADTLAALNRTSGNVVLGGANAIRQVAVENSAPSGTTFVRSDVAAGSFVGAVNAAGANFPAVAGATTQAADLSLTNTTGGITVNQPVRSVGTGRGNINVTGAIVNADLAAAAGSTVTITGNSVVLPDTVINAPLATGNTTISATRDIIVSAALTSSSTAGLALLADSDNSGTGGILFTATGSLVAGNLTAPLTLRGSSIVNSAGIGGAGLGVGNLLHIQSGGSVRTVQPVEIRAQSNAPAAAGVVLNGSAANPAIATTGGGVSFAVPGSISLNGGSLTSALLSASGPVTFGPSAVTLAGNTRLVSPSTVFGAIVNGAFGLSLSGAGSFNGVVGGAVPLASLAVDGTSSVSGNVTTAGAQTYTGAAMLNADTVLTATNSNITFGSTVNSASATARNLTVSAGSGAVTIGGTTNVGIGGTNALNAIVINSSGNSRVSGVTAASLTSDAGGTLTIAGPVAANTVTVNDPLTIEGTGVTTTGNQTYASSVQLRASARFASSSGSIAFRGTVLPDAQASNRSFEASAAAGNLSVAGDIGADNNRFGSVLLNGRSVAVNNVFSTGALSLAMGTGASDVIEISGSRISSSNGIVTLGSTPPKTSPSTRASINKGNVGDLTIDGNQVIFQPYERTSISGGNLTVTGRNSAVLGTTAVSGSLVVTTPSLSIYQRASAPVDLGLSVGADSGTDIVASNVDFAVARDPVSGVATVPLNGVPPASAFSIVPLGATATNAGVSIATLNPPVNAPSSPSIRYLNLRGAGFAGPTIEPARFGAVSPLLSLVAQGTAGATFEVATSSVLPPAVASTVIHLGHDVAGDEDDTDGPAVPLEKLNPPLVDVELSAALREQLQNLGVFARRLTPEERVARERFLPFYDQVPRKTDVRDRDYEVVDARVSKESAILAVAEWQRQFLKEGTTQSRVPDITAALVRAYDAFRAANSATDAIGFRNWLESRSNDASITPALGFVQEVGQLFRRLEIMGLTRAELEVAKTQILFRVLQEAPSMRAGFLRRVIEAGTANANTPGARTPSRSAATEMIGPAPSRG